MAQEPTPREVKIKVRDGVEIGAAIYAPEGGGRFPALLAASPYRYDDNVLPASPQFLWRETGPIELLPFYDHYLKGERTDYEARPPVEYFVRGANLVRSANTWPPKDVRYEAWHLHKDPSGSVTCLNDGALAATPASGEASTSYRYPVQGWVSGVVGFGPAGPAGGFDPVRRVLTFTSAALQRDLEIAGPIKLVLYASTTRTDTDFFIKVQEQMPQSSDDRAKDINPPSQLVSKGWLRASHRALDPRHSTEHDPYTSHAKPEPVVPGQIYKYEIRVEPMAYRFKQGNRIRLEIVNGDSPVTDVIWTHLYTPNKIGEDTIHHGAQHASALILPVMA